MMPQGMSFGGGFDFMFTLVPILIGIVFVIVIVGFISNGARYVKNAKSPRTSEFAGWSPNGWTSAIIPITTTTTTE